jgi:hypothetical protein
MTASVCAVKERGSPIPSAAALHLSKAILQLALLGLKYKACRRCLPLLSNELPWALTRA